jgi:hypothetical protein
MRLIVGSDRAWGGDCLVTGWLGGELVDRLGVGVDEGANLNATNSLAGEGRGSLPRSTPVASSRPA